MKSGYGTSELLEGFQFIPDISCVFPDGTSFCTLSWLQVSAKVNNISRGVREKRTRNANKNNPSVKLNVGN